MSAITPKEQIISLTQPVAIPSGLQRRMAGSANSEGRINKIAAILNDNPDLVQDTEAMARVFAFTKDSKNRETVHLRQEWAFQACCKLEGGIYKMDFKDYIPPQIQTRLIRQVKDFGYLDVKRSTLTLTPEALEKVGSTLWDVIKKEEIKTLVVRDGDQSFEYKNPLLAVLQEKKPKAPLLHETATVKFEEGELTLPKATLIACGDYFSAAFSGNFKVSDKIDLTENVTLNGFNGILSRVETGLQDPDTIEEDLNEAIDFLNTSSLPPAYPEGIIGPKEWEEHFGVVDNFPPPLALVQDLQELRSQGKDPLVCLIPTTVDGKPFCHNLLAELIQNPKAGHKTKICYFSQLIKAELKGESPDKPYYILMDKDVLAGTRGKSPEVHQTEVQKYSREQKRDYEVFKFLASETAILLHYVKTGERLFSDNPWTYTRCVEIVTFQGNNYSVVVGGFSPDGLNVIPQQLWQWPRSGSPPSGGSIGLKGPWKFGPCTVLGPLGYWSLARCLLLKCYCFCCCLTKEFE